MPHHLGQEPPGVFVARLTLRAEEVKERTARVALVQELVGLASAIVKAVSVIVAAGVLALGVVSCDQAGDGGARQEHPAVPQQTGSTAERRLSGRPVRLVNG